jgi:N-acetylneuraminate synthase
MKHIYIIAEIGCNHCGDPKLAKKMVDEAKACGVDAVKFQTFKAAELISKYAPKADYQKVTTGNDENQLEMTRKLELPYDEFIKLRDYAVSLELDTFSTPFDMDSIAFLEQQKQAIWKIPSGEVTNLPFLEKIAKYKIPNKKTILFDDINSTTKLRSQQGSCC